MNVFSRPSPRRFLLLKLFSAGIITLLVTAGFIQHRAARELPHSYLDTGGLQLPGGFEAVVVVDSIGPARHLTVRDNGDIYVKLRRVYPDGGLVALRDTDGDSRADIIRRFGFYEAEGAYETGIEIHKGYLYFSTDLEVYRYRLIPGELIPDARMDTIMVDDMPVNREHIAKPISFDGKGNMYIPFGSPTDACQSPNRAPGVAGQDPCPDLERNAGIWRFDEDGNRQAQADGYKYATGIRSVVAMDWNPADGNLYVVAHGRDRLNRFWPELYSRWESHLLPSEEFMRVTDGSNFGWPYCHYDHIQGKRILNPEYGGDGEAVGRCSAFDDPVVGFPGHFSPMDLKFYQGDQFPERYKNGAFIAFAGSNNHFPYPQAGYFVAFVPFEDGEPSGDWEVFANGFAGIHPIANINDTRSRPMGLATGPDGSLYVLDNKKGKIWRITYKGDRTAFGRAKLAGMEEVKRTASNIRTPREIEDNLETGVTLSGERLYTNYCFACHQRDGNGLPGLFPPLAGSEWVTGDKQRLLSVIRNGLDGPITVKGEAYNGVMPPHRFLSDEELAEIATYVRQNFGNEASAVTVEEVQALQGQ